MISFRTIVDVPESRHKIGYETSSIWIGSCFTENIGLRLRDLKFPHAVNPFGILYNPASIGNSLSILMEGRQFTPEDLRHGNGLWYSFFHHTSFSHPDPEECARQINDSINYSRTVLEKAGLLFVTFGTARVYRLKETGEIVSNCHKLPHNWFEHILLDAGMIIESWTNLISELVAFNPGLQIVFTISPVRHWKDGAHGNQVSKATLILVISKLREMFGNVLYFPAYEIVMDELRDYRFYDEDMLHINNQGVNYIWERFSDSYITPSAFPVMKEIKAIRQALDHRPFNPSTLQYRTFLDKTIARIDAVEKLIPSADFSDEKSFIASQLDRFFK
jgi:hypothetical protein